MKKIKTPLLLINAFIFVVFYLYGMPWFIRFIASRSSLGNHVLAINEGTIYAYLLTAIIGLALFWPILKEKFIQWKKQLPKQLLLAGIGFGAIILVNILFQFVHSTNQANIQQTFQQLSGMQKWFYAGIVAFVAPFVEELLFRQALLGNMSEVISKWIMIILTGILFGLFHIQYLNQWIQAIPYIIIGIIFGTIYVLAGKNLWCTYSIHLLNNLISLAFLL